MLVYNTSTFLYTIYATSWVKLPDSTVEIAASSKVLQNFFNGAFLSS